MSLFEIHQTGLEAMSSTDLNVYLKQMCPLGIRTLEELKDSNIVCDDIILIEQCIKELQKRKMNISFFFNGLNQ